MLTVYMLLIGDEKLYTSVVLPTKNLSLQSNQGKNIKQNPLGEIPQNT